MSKMDALTDVISPALLKRTYEISQQLNALKIPHVLIGGLAIGVHGYVRATSDVDFLVGDEAFATMSPFLTFREELKELARVGETDMMSVPPQYPMLKEELRIEDDVPVISLEGLILMKLEAFRARDQEDVSALLAMYPQKLREIRDYIQMHAPELSYRLAELLVR